MMKYEYGNLGTLIRDCGRHGICATDHNVLPCVMSNPIKVGHFAFSANCHSTGISVYVFLVHPDTGETYEIINGTYWHSESTYGFNKFMWKKGKWDTALAEAIQTLKDLLAERVAYHQKKQAAADEAEKTKAQVEKEKYEALFCREAPKCQSQ